MPALRHLLDDLTFVLTGTELARLFLPIVQAAGLPTALTEQRVNDFDFDVDFFWP